MVWCNKQLKCNKFSSNFKVLRLKTFLHQPDSQGLHLRYPRYGEDPDTGWSRATQILGA